MTPLHISVPDSCAELDWVISVLFTEYLGIGYRLETVEAESFSIRRDGRSLDLPNIFFSLVKKAWLDPISLPAERSGPFDTDALGFPVNTLTKRVPVIYGKDERGAELGDRKIYLPIDLFGSAFFMLSRYEEAVIGERDMHGRFPAVASAAYRNGFLNRPIIDEYMEILWACMKKLWPDMERRRQAYRTLVTCDVDHPYHASARSLSRLVRRVAGELVHKRTCMDAIKPVMNYVASRHGNWRHDPYYYTVDWMMEVNERAGNKASFNFIPEVTAPLIDGASSITEPAVRAMLRRIACRGHEVGIHPGYHSYQSAGSIAAGKEKLEHVLDQESVPQRVMGGRQHYLRWSTYTPANWDAAGLEYDSTLSYADCAGFRCGTCHEYSMYDLHNRKRLAVKQRALICMEVCVIDTMGLGFTDSAMEMMCELKRATRQMNGDFTLLWHNSSLDSARAREMYCEIIS